MKKLIFTFVIAFSFMFMNNIQAQSYNSAVGAKLGGWFVGTYKKQIKESWYVDFYAGFYGYFSNSLIAGAALEIHKPIESVENLYWYYGGGASVTTGYSLFGIGINGTLGLDYAFTEIPLNVSVDWMPGFYLSGYYKGPSFGLGALSVRYILSQN